MRIDDDCRDPELLAAEVRRLRAVIAAGEPALAAAEREAIEAAISSLLGLEDSVDDSAACTLRTLLERTE